MTVGDGCARAGSACAGSGVGDSAVQSARVAARQQGDRRRPHRATRRARRSRRGVARPQPRPGDAAGEALIVEPGRLVPGDARRQDLGLPGAGRRLEAFELAEHRGERVRPLHARVVGVTRCQSNRKRRKSRAATGSISARSRFTV